MCKQDSMESGDGKISAEEVEQLNSLLVAQGTLKENLARMATKLDKVSHSKAAPNTVTHTKTEREREEGDTPQRHTCAVARAIAHSLSRLRTVPLLQL